jgi:hypothetical protein
MKDEMTKGFCMKPTSAYNSQKPVGKQGAGQADMAGAPVDAVSKPGVMPRKMGSMKMGGMQGPIQPKVGK